MAQAQSIHSGHSIRQTPEPDIVQQPRAEYSREVNSMSSRPTPARTACHNLSASHLLEICCSLRDPFSLQEVVDHFRSREPEVLWDLPHAWGTLRQQGFVRCVGYAPAQVYAASPLPDGRHS